MKNRIFFCNIIIIILLIVTSVIIEGVTDKSTILKINIKENQNVTINLDTKIRIGYCQSTPDPEATGIMYYTLVDLEKQGVISGMEGYKYKPFIEDGNDLWTYVCTNVQSNYIEFVKDFFYDLEEDTNTQKILDRLINKDIDLMITYGTRAGNEFYNDKHDVNLINFGSNDPIKSGFIKSKEDSGRDNFWAHIDTQRYYNQIKMFYDAVKFKKLGVIQYTDSFRKNFTPTDEIEEISNKYGFEYKIYDFYNVDQIFEVGDKTRYYSEIKELHEQIARECDAFYMIIGGWSYDDLEFLLEPFIKNDIPIFSQFGSIEVKNGALMSVGKVDFTDIGTCLSDVIIRILNGEKPRNIPQEYAEKVGVAINMQTAKKIGYKPTVQFIINCDEIYK